jgi:hypothetical protein
MHLFLRRGNAFTNDCRATMLLRAADGVTGLTLVSPTRQAWSGVRGNPLFSHEPREILTPPTQHSLIEVQTAPLFALGLHDQVNVRVLLITVQDHGIAVLCAEFLARELPSSGQYLLTLPLASLSIGNEEAALTNSICRANANRSTLLGDRHEAD